MPRKLGEKLSERIAIPYATIKRMITTCPTNIDHDKPYRTRALLAFQYALGCRVGELAKEYTHKFNETKTQSELVASSKGICKKDIQYTDALLFVRRPNFKQKNARNRPERTLWHRSIVSRVREPWLFDIMFDWVSRIDNPDSHLFNIRRARISSLIDTQLKKEDKSYSTHLLRHSRATHLGELTRDPIAVKGLLGHARVDTSMKYVHYTEQVLLERLGDKRFEDVLGRDV